MIWLSAASITQAQQSPDTLSSQQHGFRFIYPGQWNIITQENTKILVDLFKRDQLPYPLEVLAIFNHNTNLTPIGYPFLLLAVQHDSLPSMALQQDSMSNIRIMHTDIANFIKPSHAEKIKDFTSHPPVMDTANHQAWFMSSMTLGVHGLVHSIRAVTWQDERMIILALQVKDAEKDSYFEELMQLLKQIEFLEK